MRHIVESALSVQIQQKLCIQWCEKLFSLFLYYRYVLIAQAV